MKIAIMGYSGAVSRLGNITQTGGNFSMKVFERFKKQKLSDEQLRWNKLWELWEKQEAASPYAELMTYQSEINNGGHAQYFFNTENTGDLQAELAMLERILPDVLRENLQSAYQVYLSLGSTDEEEAQEALSDRFDDVFYENEAAINEILKQYASTLAL